MSYLLATATDLPPFRYDQETAERHVRAWLGEEGERLQRILGAFERGAVASRASVMPIEEIFRPRGFGEKNALYMRAAVEMGERAVRKCLDRAGLRPRDVDCFISASCTGFMIPSLDARLAHRLGMKESLARLPITQHGCAGGAVALRQAHEHLLAYPDHTVLVLAAEVPTATFLPNDRSPANIVSASLFGDGAAAAVLRSDGKGDRPRIFATSSRLFPDSEHLMGFDLTDEGLRMVLSRDVPEEIARHAPGAILSLLASEGYGLEDVRHFLLHPGGRRIVESFERRFGLGDGALATTRAVLRDCGNLSSATVLFILDRHASEGGGEEGDLGILAAFGPGFGCESLLLAWGVEAPARRRGRTARAAAAPRPR